VLFPFYCVSIISWLETENCLNKLTCFRFITFSAFYLVKVRFDYYNEGHISLYAMNFLKEIVRILDVPTSNVQEPMISRKKQFPRT